MATNLYIVRHGEAVCNVENIIGGTQGCQGLTTRGHAQVARLAQRLAQGEIKVDALYGSTFRRARETAEAVSGALKLPVQWDDGLQELRPGEADGMPFAEWNKHHGPFRFDAPYQPFAPGGESWATFTARAGETLLRIIRDHPDQTVVCVAHGGVVEASFYAMLGLDPATQSRAGFWVDHTSLTRWWCKDIHEPRWILRRYNDVQHLVGFDPKAEE